jgi:hypothetical protein
MKAKRLLWAVVALFATFSMTVALSSCGDKGNEPGGGGEVVVPDPDEPEEPEPEDKPEVANPAADQTTFLFQIENAPCEEFELYLMGIGGVWEDTPEMKFSRVEGTTSWFQVTVPAMDDSQANFKIRANGDWAFEPKAGYEFLDDAAEYVEGGADGGNPNNLMMLQAAGGKVIALKVIEFASPCAEAVNYKVTLKTSYCDAEGSEFTVGIIGSIPGSSWGTVFPMEKIDDTTYEYTIEGGMKGMEFKFQSTAANWSNEPKIFVPTDEKPEGDWKGMDNYKLADETNISIDLTEYTWSACIPAAE